MIYDSIAGHFGDVVKVVNFVVVLAQLSCYSYLSARYSKLFIIMLQLLRYFTSNQEQNSY